MKHRNSIKLWIPFSLALALPAIGAMPSSPAAANASAASAPLVQLPAVHVEAEAESDHFVQGPFLPDVQGTKINAGKKTTILDLDSLPRITGNNYRQALAQTPGLVLSEETSPLISIGYRGLEPHRAQFTQVLKDGIPIHADQSDTPKLITRRRSIRSTGSSSSAGVPR